jgi:hypothetical protein
MADVERFSGKDLTQTQDSLVIRFWSEISCVSISCNGMLIDGELTLLTERTDGSDQRAKAVHPHRTSAIPDSTCIAILEAFSRLGIGRLPPQEQIPGWADGNDGEVFVVEVATPTTYWFHDYWTPRLFPKIPTAVDLQRFADEVERLLNLGYAFELFVHALPKGCYRAGGLSMLCTDRSQR